MGPGQQNYGGYPQQFNYQQTQPSRQTFQNFANNNNMRPTQGLSQQYQLLQCRFVDNPEDIMPVDVPSNGEPAFFVDRNFSRIYAKAVNSRGTIDEVVYEPVKRQSPEEIKQAKDQEFQNMVIKRFENLENMLAAFLTQPDPKEGQVQDPSTKSKGGSK